MSEAHYAEAARLLSYRPSTGELINKYDRSSNSLAGKVMDCRNNNGYIQVSIAVGGVSKVLLAHRIIWYKMMDRIPDNIDHINRVRDDNRWDNLREVTHAENMRNKSMYKNNQEGYRGVSWHNPGRKWRANIRIRGINKHLGYFECPEKASECYEKFHRIRKMLTSPEGLL